MADALLKIGGMGGTSSDELTATKNQVLQGYTAVTSDSDDEPIEGTIVNRGNIVDTSGFENAHWDSKFLARMEQGFYLQNGQWKPCVAIPYAVLVNVVGIDAGKMLDTLTVAGVRGNIRAYGAWNNALEVVNATWENKVHVRFEEGYYPKDGNYKPAAVVPYETLANTIGLDASKMLSSISVLGKQGQIKMINTQDNDYNINKSTAFGIDRIGRFWIDFPHGNGYYFRGDNHPHTCIDASNFGTAAADSVLQWQTATSQHGVKFEGSIPRWICNSGDVISANNGAGFVWDDSYAGRGRGIVVGIPNNHYIQGANWVFLSSPNLYPQNVRAGVNINGVVGTMQDYSTGRVVFNGATFDGTLLLGVANKDFYIGRDYYASYLDGNYRYSGIHDGGINLALNVSMPSIRGRYIGCIMSQSVNLTPFNRIDVYWRFVGDIKNDAYMDFIAGVSKASTLNRGGVYIGSAPKDGFTEAAVSAIASSPHITKSGKIELYVGGINEQGFLYFYASADISSNRDSLNGSIQITRIDFLN